MELIYSSIGCGDGPRFICLPFFLFVRLVALLRLPCPAREDANQSNHQVIVMLFVGLAERVTGQAKPCRSLLTSC